MLSDHPLPSSWKAAAVAVTESGLLPWSPVGSAIRRIQHCSLKSVVLKVECAHREGLSKHRSRAPHPHWQSWFWGGAKNLYFLAGSQAMLRLLMLRSEAMPDEAIGQHLGCLRQTGTPVFSPRFQVPSSLLVLPGELYLFMKLHR